MKAGFLLLLSVSTAFAQGGVSGELSFTFTNSPIWDLTGEYVRTSDSATLTLDITHSPKGKITGTRHEVYSHDQDYYEGQGAVEGVVASELGGTVARATSKGTYTGVMSGISFSATAVSNDKVLVMPASLSVRGQSKVRLCVKGGRCTTAKDTYEVALPDEMTGHWTLDLSLGTVGKTVSGSARITLSNGKVLHCGAKGRYDVRHRLASISLKGVSESSGTRLSFVLPLNGFAPSGFRGSVMGQKIDYLNHGQVIGQWPR